MPVLPRRRHEVSEPVEELKWGKLNDAAGARPCGLPPASRADPVGHLVSRENVADAGDAAVFTADHGEPLQREGRPGTGLMRQHLTAVRAAAEVGQAQVEGDAVASQSLAFSPGSIRGGRYEFAVGTAGSGTLVLQTVLPALLLADASSEITIGGGTHNPWAPPFDFLAQAYFPRLGEMGADVSAALERRGFFPAGGGRFSISLQPPQGPLKGLDLTTRGEVRQRSVTAVVANLPRAIGQREVDAAAKKLTWPPDCFHVHEANDAAGPGNIVMIEVNCDNVREVFTGFGRQGIPAERVASDAVHQVREYLAADVPVGKYLADQLILPLSIAAWFNGSKSCFRTLPLSRHSTTQIDIVRRFLNVSIETETEGPATTLHIG
jgi:RNA 3'-terminal phosphate cyclase (ATP)